MKNFLSTALAATLCCIAPITLNQSAHAADTSDDFTSIRSILLLPQVDGMTLEMSTDAIMKSVDVHNVPRPYEYFFIHYVLATDTESDKPAPKGDNNNFLTYQTAKQIESRSDAPQTQSLRFSTLPSGYAAWVLDLTKAAKFQLDGNVDEAEFESLQKKGVKIITKVEKTSVATNLKDSFPLTMVLIRNDHPTQLVVIKDQSTLDKYIKRLPKSLQMGFRPESK